MSLVKNWMECNIIIAYVYIYIYNDSVTLFCAKDESEAGGAEAITRTNGGRGVGGLLSVNGIGITEKPCWMFGWLDLTHYTCMDKKTDFLESFLQPIFNVYIICLSVFTDCYQTMFRIGLCTLSWPIGDHNKCFQDFSFSHHNILIFHATSAFFQLFTVVSWRIRI